MPGEPIQRYGLCPEGSIRPIVPYMDGDWVKYADHAAVCDRLRAANAQLGAIHDTRTDVVREIEDECARMEADNARLRFVLGMTAGALQTVPREHWSNPTPAGDEGYHNIDRLFADINAALGEKGST
jgi:hypothetical protein